MKKVLIGVGVVIVIALYVIFANRSTPPTSNTLTLDNNGTTTTMGEPSSSIGANSGTGNNGGTTTGQFKDGTYTGPVTDAIYGQLQIIAVVQNGQLTDVQFPVYPNNAGHSMQISQNALPILKQEAIAAQGANVNVVSGATQTSEAFQQSLAAALVMAK